MYSKQYIVCNMVWYVKYCQYYVLYIAILYIVPYNMVCYNTTVSKSIDFSFVVMICVGVILSILYCWFVDTVDLLQKWYPTINHNEMNHHGDSRALRRIKNAANQRKRHPDPARREAEQVADTAWRHIAREEPGRREEEQVANTAHWHIARE